MRCIWGKQVHLPARSWGTPQTHDEPGENATLREMKQTAWSISCSSSWICTSSSQLKWKRWLTIGGRPVLRGSNGVPGGRDLKDFHWTHVWNIQFLRSTVVFSKFGLNHPIWQHHCLEDYYMLSKRFGFFIFPVVDSDCSTPQRTAHRIDFWQSLMHLLQSPPLFSDALANQFKGRGWQPLTSTATQPPVIPSGCSLCLVRGLQNRFWHLGSR